ncbi:MAG: hypothetical protein K2P92_05415 [Bdellovibrionaceae bacterium]|nr:hypothetical protein [Pseudobdellovibrionaceae bacterium]
MKKIENIKYLERTKAFMISILFFMMLCVPTLVKMVLPYGGLALFFAVTAVVGSYLLFRIQKLNEQIEHLSK